MGCICLIVLIFTGCSHREKIEATPLPTEDLEQEIYDNNVAIVQDVSGYSKSDAKALARILQQLAEKGTIQNSKITCAEEFIDHYIDSQGVEYNDTYLHFVTEDNETFYALITGNSDVYVIYRGPIENNEYVWGIIE